MIWLKTILIIILIIIAIILAIIILILIIPFKYNFIFTYKNENRIDINLKYMIFKLNGFFSYKPKIDYEFKLCNKTIIKKDDDAKKKNDENGKSIADTDFIENKNLEKDIKESKNAIKDLLIDAKKLENKKVEEYKKDLVISEKKQSDESELINNKETNDEKKNRVFEKVDKFKNLIDKDSIRIIKKVFGEVINILAIFKPQKNKVNIKYGDRDPYIMGMTLAFAAPLYTFMGDDLSIMKNSNSEFTEGSIIMIGYPKLYKLIIPTLRLLKDKEIRDVIFA